MNLDYYKWPPRRIAGTTIPPVDIAVAPAMANDAEAAAYIPHRDLVSAINVALLLGKPLLVTGDPGTGKTRLAASIAWQLGYAGPHKFVAKSTSQARDIFYTYDALGRFHAAEQARMPGSQNSSGRRAERPLDFIEYAALGRAILTAHQFERVAPFLPAAGQPHGFQHPDKPMRSVVLIDEIDKAPRDFPNDLLDEIETMRFRVPELREEATPELTDRSLRPVIVITSNRERHLPDAFLRRCLFFEIPFPPRRTHSDPPEEGYFIEDIVARRLSSAGGASASGELAKEAFDFFTEIRDLRDPLGKRPATAELLDWLEALRGTGASSEQGLRSSPDLVRQTLSTLFKGGDDLKRGAELFEAFLARQA